MVHRSRNVGRSLVFAMALVGGIAAAVPVSAHGGDGTLEVGEPEPVGSLEIEFPVRVTYVSDGHAAEEVDGLTVTGKGPDGSSVGPLDVFTPGDAPGVHIARLAVPVPGTWELTIDVIEPPATASITVEVAGDGADLDDTTTAAPGTRPPDAAPADTVPPDVVPSDTATTVIDDLAGASTTGDDGSVPIAVVVVAFAAAALTGWVAYRMFIDRMDAET